MKDPVRWRHANGGADAETRALLTSDAGPSPSPDEASRIWTGLASQLGRAPAPQVVPTTGTAALVGKITLAVVLVSALGVGLYRWRSQHRPGRTEVPMVEPSEELPRAGTGTAERAAAAPPKQVAAASVSRSLPGLRATAEAASAGRERRTPLAGPARSRSGGEAPPQRSPAPTALEVQRAPEREAEDKPLASSWGPSPFSTPTPAASGDPAVPVNQLLAESRQLERARAALRAHDPDRALELLGGGATHASSLAQEREALVIEAMAAKPALRAKAVARARAFLSAYAQSPYRARIRAITASGE